MSARHPLAHDQSWQNAWSDAQDRISRIRADVAASPSPHPRITRVGKVDAELLDAELVQLLKEPLTKALSLVNSAWKAQFEPELGLLIQLVLYKFSVWDQGSSYGAKLQGLKYAPPPGSRSRIASGLPGSTLAVHIVATIFVPYLHNRLRSHALSNAWPDAPSSDRRRKSWELLTRLESIHSAAGLLNFVFFLWNGRYRTLADRVLRLRLVSARRHFQREVSYEFMNRQMVWHAFTEFLLFLLPLVNTRALRRQFTSITSCLTVHSIMPSRSGAAQTEKKTRRGKFWTLPEDQCAICAENASTNLADPAAALSSLTSFSPYATTGSDGPAESSDPEQVPQHPIHTPYVTSCGHVYCYYCVTDRMMRTADERSGVGPKGTQWKCLRCAEGVAAADRTEADAEGPEYESGVDDDDDAMSFEFGSESMDTEFTGSAGSYADSESDGLSSD
ncbi:peroxisomal biogenesis factor 2 [Trametes versicolor FP-101664 SS1]|uniref:peroxisomal biogenesis factor 2 n=1 Tax=Trametes versicolor (strain FP-101664) TaxID=717944 RepID=UPI000462345D|nr:peroxisomal biogenesis factor 2 [Trametes versicolor FP-101664 SS1]EIW61839.1 peroxisomal biogenesis factor 2 [Trametes versicolor FP-101664 SS1]